MKKYVYLLVLLLLPFLVCACAKDEGLLADTITGSYRETIIPIPDKYRVGDEVPAYSNGAFSVGLLYLDENNIAYTAFNKQTISFDKSGGNITVTPYQGSELISDSWEIDDTTFISDEYFSVTYMSGGNKIAILDLPEIFNYDIEKELANIKITPLTFSIIDIIGNNSGTFYILTTKGICAVASDGSVRWTQTERKNPTALVMTDAGILYLAESNGENTLRFVNENDGSLGDTVDMPECIKGGTGIGSAVNGVSFYRGDSAYDFYAATGQALWGVTVKSDKNGAVSCDTAECLNWLNSDISPSTVVSLCIADENTVAVIAISLILITSHSLFFLIKDSRTSLPE